MAGFTRWLNFLLTPHDEESAPKGGFDVGGLFAGAMKGGSVPTAPTREVLSLKVGRGVVAILCFFVCF